MPPEEAASKQASARIEHFLYTVLGARPDYLAANPDVIARLVRGLTRGAALIHADAGKAGALIHKEFFAQTDAQLVSGTVADQKTTIDSPLVLSQAQFKQNVEFMLRFGHEVQNVTYGDVINDTWVKAT